VKEILDCRVWNQRFIEVNPFLKAGAGYRSCPAFIFLIFGLLVHAKAIKQRRIRTLPKDLELSALCSDESGKRRVLG